MSSYNTQKQYSYPDFEVHAFNSERKLEERILFLKEKMAF